MRMSDNFLTSGHEFSKNDGLQKFRFAFLNILLLVPTLVTVINLIVLFAAANDSDDGFEKAVLFYFSGLIALIILLRKDRKYYLAVVSLFTLSTLTLFYFVTLTRPEDEFRMIGFFIGVFNTYVLLGKKAGALLGVIIVISVVLISSFHDMELSSQAFTTFYSFFIPFTVFLYFFLDKVEKDSLEFEVLHNRLREKVKLETNHRMEQEQMLLRRSRMANMGEMLDSIAHQWRQPLMHINSILLNIESALDRKSENDNDKDYLNGKLDEIAVLTTHMSQTIEDFRGLFKVEKEYTNFNLQEVTNDVLALLKNNLNDIELERRNLNDVEVLGHRSELMQVIIIVLSNSIDVLNTRKIDSKKIILDIKLQADSVCITIEDNAGGISVDNAERIFDPYFTTKEQSGGTGLGLYIAKIIVEHNMGGAITVSNTANGAKFSICLLTNPTAKILNST